MTNTPVPQHTEAEKELDGILSDLGRKTTEIIVETLASDVERREEMSEAWAAAKSQLLALTTRRLSALLDELEAAGPKDIEFSDSDGEYRRNYEGYNESNSQWRALLAKKREATIDAELDRLKGKDAG